MCYIEASDPQLRGQIFPQRFYFVCPSYPVSINGLGKAGSEGHDILICPVFPPNHILRSGNLADILSTSRSVIMKCQRIPKKLETACFCYSHRQDNPYPPPDAWGKRQHRGQPRAGCLASSTVCSQEGRGYQKVIRTKYCRCSPRLGNKFNSLRRLIIWDCIYQGTPITEEGKSPR